MTNTDTAPNTDITHAHEDAQQMPDPRPMLANAVATSQRVFDGLRADQLDQPTPCTEFTVGQLANHLLFALDRIASVGKRPPAAATDYQLDIDGTDPKALSDRHRALVVELADAWADDARLGEMCDLEWAVLPGAIAVSMYVNEVLVHGWDLAAATGQDLDWDDATVAFALASIQIGLPADGREHSPFDDVVAVPADAPLMHQLIAWNGRIPT